MKQTYSGASPHSSILPARQSFRHATPTLDPHVVDGAAERYAGDIAVHHRIRLANMPRVLDMSQCNDAYSATKVATAPTDAFETDINGLRLSLITS